MLEYFQRPGDVDPKDVVVLDSGCTLSEIKDTRSGGKSLWSFKLSWPERKESSEEHMQMQIQIQQPKQQGHGPALSPSRSEHSHSSEDSAPNSPVSAAASSSMGAEDASLGSHSQHRSLASRRVLRSGSQWCSTVKVAVCDVSDAVSEICVVVGATGCT